jgi:hypothetical protein
MTDRIPGAPGRYSASLPNGELVKMQNGEPFAITLTRDDDPIVEGTPYSKASVLPDELAAALCPGLEDPDPKDAFAALSTDFVVAQGVSGNWSYRKWASGVAECWGTFTFSGYDNEVGVTPIVGLDDFRLCNVDMVTPFEFINDKPVVTASLDHTGEYAMFDSKTEITQTSGITAIKKSFFLNVGGSTDVHSTITASIKVTGYWK